MSPRRSRAFRPVVGDFLEARVALSGAPAAIARPRAVPTLSLATYDRVRRDIDSAFRTYQGPSVFEQAAGAVAAVALGVASFLLNDPTTAADTATTDSTSAHTNKSTPTARQTLRDNVEGAVSRLPFAARQLTPAVDWQLGKPHLTPANSPALRDRIKYLVQQHVIQGVRDGDFRIAPADLGGLASRGLAAAHRRHH